ncbi:MAG: TraB/GumN family protein [Cyclobacteriaceae bacterium]|nr:TraB/GumN family protein [Cyclobacteriaceae bacterium]
MKKGILFLLLAFWVLIPGMSQDNSILWEVSGNGITKPSFLFGSLKFIGENEYYLPKEATEKILSSTLFVIEDQVDHHAQHELNKALHFPKNESLATHLSPDDYKKVTDFFEKEFSISKKEFDSKYARLKPLPISISMTRLSLGENVKFYDIELLRFAKKNKIKAFSLESVKREADALNTFSIEDQSAALLHSIDNFDRQKEEYRKLMLDYPQGKLDEIFAYTLHTFENNDLFIEEFYFKRNEEWLPKIEKMMKEEVAFISVGVSHLEGERGLLELLKSKGYSLKPIAVTR